MQIQIFKDTPYYESLNTWGQGRKIEMQIQIFKYSPHYESLNEMTLTI